MQFLEGSLVHWLHDSMVQLFIGSVFQWFIGSMDFHVIVYLACFKTASCLKHIFEHLSFEFVNVCFLTIHTYLLYSLLKGLVRCQRKMHETKCRKTFVSPYGNLLKSPPQITYGLAHLTQLKQSYMDFRIGGVPQPCILTYFH